MITSLPRRAPRHISKSIYLTVQVALLIAVAGAFTTLQAASKPPILITAAAPSTRAVAFESVTMKPEPFSPTSTVLFSTDNRTRIAIFARDLELYAGEGANAFSADVEDSTGKRYLLKVEYVGRVPGFEGITMLIVRFADDLGNVGDVLLRVNLHGVASNRVRIAIGSIGGGLPVDPATEYSSPAPATPPAPDPVATPDPFTGPATDADTVRFLEQATWGVPSQAEINRVKAMGFRAYLNEQFALTPTNPAKGSNYPDIAFNVNDDSNIACPTSSPGDPNYNQTVCLRDNFSLYPIQRTFFSNSLYGQDQLRQRVAFALHQVLVVSGGNTPLNRPSWMTIYLQSLDRGAFGNYRTLLGEITLNPEMGEYLDMRISTRTSPNENWAREVLQLLSIGVNELNLDGSPKVDAQGVNIPSYSQTTVNEFTKLFTGWTLAPPTGFPAGVNNWRDPMVPRAGNNHDQTAKVLLNGVTVPACVGTSQVCAQSDLIVGLDNIFNHPNVGPFIGKQMIQHLVTSNPSRAYVERVAKVFNNDCDALYPGGCTGVRGNMRAVVQAVLLDPEARGGAKTDPNYGKLREPAQYIVGVLRTLNVKSFDKSSTSDGVLGSRSTVDFTGSLDQIIFQPATVFSYYQPEYEVPGAKILGPAFGILSTSTTLKRANNINTLVYSGVAANTTPTQSPDRPRGTSVDLANIEAMAANPSQIADYLNALMLHGTMSTQVRNSITTAMNAIPTSDANFARKRAQAAVYLVATSSQYDIQR